MSKISGPLLDRIDIHIEVPAVPFKELSDSAEGTSSATLRAEVATARKAQQRRFVNIESTRQNAQLSSRQIRQFCRLDRDSLNQLKTSVNEMGLSARAHDKVLRVARTIADLGESDAIRLEHIQEAINYRMLDRQMWT
jgi:magnesium chelatase family protein